MAVDIIASMPATLTARAVLTVDERISLAKCEADMQDAIETISRAWLKFAQAAAVIHDQRLYREWCDTFDDYIEQKWRPLSRSTVYEWLQAAGVVLNIESHAAAYAVVIEPPQRVSHARELSRLPADEQAPALMEAREAAQARGRREPTKYEIERVVTRRLYEPEPRSPQETAHTREQRSLADAIRRFWQRLDADMRSALLSEFAFAMSETSETHESNDDN